MPLQRGPNGDLLRGPGGNLTRDPDCCCGDSCLLEYIPCCVRNANWRIKWDVLPGPTNLQVFIDREVTVRLVDHITPGGPFPIDSVNVARFSSVEGDRNYFSGWNVWDFGWDISRELFTPPGIPAYVIAIEIKVKHCGAFAETHPSEPAVLELISRGGIEIETSAGLHELPFAGWIFNPPYNWTVVGNKATSDTMTVGEESVVTAIFTNSPFRRVFDWGAPGPCSPEVKFKEGSNCWRRFGGTEELTGSTPGEGIPDCLADPVCECSCDEQQKMCDCLTDLTAMNTTRNGITRDELGAAPNPNNDFSITFQYLPAGSFSFSTKELFWGGQCAKIQPTVTLGYLSLSQRLLLEIWYLSLITGTYTRVAAFGDNTVFTYNDDVWNDIQIQWDFNAKVATLTCNGVSVQSAPARNWGGTVVGDLSVIGGNVIFGTGVNSGDLGSNGCFRNYQAT